MGLFDFLRRRDAPAADPSGEPKEGTTGDPGTATASQPTGIRRTVRVPLPPKAARPGDLQGLERLDLPPGRLVHPDSDGEAAPVAWVTEHDADHGELWARLVLAFPDTGLWPVVASGLRGDLSRPWFDGELGGPDEVAPDAETVLRDRVAAAAELQEDYGPPEPAEAWKVEWAGLAPAQPLDETVELACPAGPFGIALVPVARPADVPAAIGWWGPTNHDLDGGDLSAVLRSWEDRFGAVLIGVGFDTLELEVPGHPVDDEAAALLAREHYAVCPDLIDQGAETLENYVGAVASPTWTFWWD